MGLKKLVPSGLKQNLTNALGWKTNRKIVVFESDDWGSIRMPSREVYHSLLKKGIRVDQCPYCKFDSIASADDLGFLFEILASLKDCQGNSLQFTANAVMTNPDFERIKKNEFREYFYESFIDTLKRYPKHDSSFMLWKEGIENGLFFPQFHGREHLNIRRWMNSLLAGLKETRLAFEHKMFGISTTITSEKRLSYMQALDLDDSIDQGRVINSVQEGVEIFKDIFGFTPETFIAPNYVWSSEVEKLLSDFGIIGIQSQRVQNIPKPGKQIKGKKYHYLGQKNKFGQVYTLRNCHFEPSLNRGIDSVDKCLSQIENSFKWKKPAIISTHRVNYIGFIDKKNRDDNLRLLKHLGDEITKKWPDVEFLTSPQLCHLILDGSGKNYDEN